MPIHRLLLLYFFIFFYFTNTCQAQNTKLIGFSNYYYKGSLIADSLLTYVNTYDYKSRLISEYKIQRDTLGKSSDTLIALIDTNGLYYYYKDKFSEQFTKYNSQGNTVYSKLIHKRLSDGKNELDTIERNFSLTYNKRGRVVAETIVQKNNKHQIRVERHYIFLLSNRIVGEFTVSKTRKNRKGQTTMHKVWSTIPNQEKVLISHFRRKYHQNGRLKWFKKFESGELIKVTKHFYENSWEARREENFFKEDLKVVTYFEKIESL